jgi:hypothetical protein
MYRSINKMLSPHPFTPAGAEDSMKGGKRRGVPVKTLKKLLKKAGLKTTGKKAALTRRAKKAKLMMKGGLDEIDGNTTVETSFKEEPQFEDDNINETPTGQGRKGKGKSRGKKGMGMYY